MSELQEAFLFDYRGFQQAAMPLVQALDRGDLQPLMNRSIQVHQEVGSPANWILQGRGTELPTLAALRYEGISAEQMADRGGFLQGYDLLVVLSTFLRPAPSLEYDLPVLSAVLTQLGWDETEVDLLREGWSTAPLVKPGEASSPMLHARAFSAPYWHWVRPYNATGSGWLPLEEIVRLRDRLVSDRERIDSLRNWIRLPPYVETHGPETLPRQLTAEYWYQRVPVAYHQAITMLGEAADAEKGLYFVLTIG